MLRRLSHVAIAVPDLERAAATYRDVLGARVLERRSLPEHGVAVVFVELGNARVELMEPFGRDSPIATFLEKNPSGGMHHLCYEVDDICAVRDSLIDAGARVLGKGEPEEGANGRPVLFLHPATFPVR